jgi:hypothetical protein
MSDFFPQFSPQESQALIQEIGIRYTEVEPTHTPVKTVEAWIYFDSSAYWLYIWANGAWRSQKLGITQATSVQFGTWTFTVTKNTGVDTTTTHDFGFVPNMVFGTLSSGGSNNAVFFGMWQNGLESPTSIVTDGLGTSSVPFCGSDASYYVNNLSVSGNVLTIHYKNTSLVNDGNLKIWAIGN